MQRLIWFELVAVGISVLLAFLKPGVAETWYRKLLRPWENLANRRALAVALVGLAALGVSAGLSAIRWPIPRIQDEFSYLLAADTFAHGRLTNPTPPLWRHFESSHILVRPTYQSKYPPGQGLAMAAGQVLTGEPLVGVWLSWALACAALCWMLQAWTTPGWALLGSLLALVHFGVLDDWWRGRFFYWSQSLWGGAVAMAGAALVFGALGRLLRRPSPGQAAVLAFGLAVLANSRPYEGLAASLPLAAVMLGWPFTKEGPPGRVWLTKVILPLLCVLALAAGALGYYHYRVTGSPFRMPHQVQESSAHTTPHLLWSRLLSEASSSDSAVDEEAVRPEKPTRKGSAIRWLSKDYGKRFRWLWSFFLGPALTVPILVLPWVLKRRRWALFSAATCGVVLLANLGTVAGFPHYYAPVAPLVIALVVEGLRHLDAQHWRGRPAGRTLTRGLVTTVFVTFTAAVALDVYFANSDVYPKMWNSIRAKIQKDFEETGARHLIVVRGPPKVPWRNDEWVYNRADIDGSPVIWARDLGRQENEQLLDYYFGREIWLLHVGETKIGFGRYPQRRSPERSVVRLPGRG